MNTELPLVVTCGRDWARYIIKTGKKPFRTRSWWVKLPIYATKIYTVTFCKTSRKFRYQLLEKRGSFTYWKTAVSQSKEFARHHNMLYQDDIKNNLELIP